MLDNITSLTRNGLRGWFIQRVSAVILAAYTVFLCAYFLLHPHFSFWEWRDLFHLNSVRFFTVITLLSLILHSWVGVWTIITDYINPPFLRGFIEILMIVALLVFFIWGIVIVGSA